MKKRASRKSPLPTASPQSLSPSPNTTPPPPPSKNSSRKSTAVNSDKRSSPPPLKPLTSVSDLRDLLASRIRDLKSHLIDHSHSHILKDLEASHSRLHKRFKIQSQTCQQVLDEAEKDFKKTSERINESCAAMKESYAEFMADTQATTTRVCKATIPELSKSFEKAIGALQSRYGIPPT